MQTKHEKKDAICNMCIKRNTCAARMNIERDVVFCFQAMPERQYQRVWQINEEAVAAATLIKS